MIWTGTGLYLSDHNYWSPARFRMQSLIIIRNIRFYSLCLYFQTIIFCLKILTWLMCIVTSKKHKNIRDFIFFFFFYFISFIYLCIYFFKYNTILSGFYYHWEAARTFLCNSTSFKHVENISKMASKFYASFYLLITAPIIYYNKILCKNGFSKSATFNTICLLRIKSFSQKLTTICI